MTPGLVAFVLAVLAGYGAFLVFTSVAMGWRGVGVSPTVFRRAARTTDLTTLLTQAGLERVGAIEFLATSVILLGVGAAVGWAVFGGIIAPLFIGFGVAYAPVAAAIARRSARLEHAREAWPRMLEELRLQVVSLGRSVPQALFTVGARGPLELRPAFDAARREWVMSTDFGRTLDVLRAKLSDATADAVCETLLIAHEVGGTDVDRRLRALIDDRIADLEGRKDARSEQAAARFARSFVLVVPLGMATVGLTIGNGRDAYRDPLGQIGVLIALSLIAVCWLWASRMLKLPTEDRVFRGSTKEAA
ncbi:MAG: tight adherence protein B [Nitriliruptoraceae bacterium]|jgi:tight adherence protein B